MNENNLLTTPPAPAAPKTQAQRALDDAAEKLVREINRAGTMHGQYLAECYLWEKATGRLYLLSQPEELARFVLRHDLQRYSKNRFWQVVELAAEKLMQDCPPMETDFAAFMCCQGPGMDGTPVTREQLTPWVSAAFRVWFNY